MKLLHVSMVLAVLNVNAAHSKSSLSNLIADTQANGIPKREGDIGNKLLDLKGLEVRAKAVARTETTDRLMHEFDVAMASGVPQCIIFGTHWKEPKTFTGVEFRATLDGKLQKAAQVVADYDVDGKPIPTSGKFAILDPKDKGVRDRFQHELDFWLKGKYRKSPDKKSSAPSTAP